MGKTFSCRSPLSQEIHIQFPARPSIGTDDLTTCSSLDGETFSANIARQGSYVPRQPYPLTPFGRQSERFSGIFPIHTEDTPSIRNPVRCVPCAPPIRSTVETGFGEPPT